MNIHIVLDDPKKCDGCPLLDTPPLWQGKPTALPECTMGYSHGGRRQPPQTPLYPLRRMLSRGPRAVLRLMGNSEGESL